MNAIIQSLSVFVGVLSMLITFIIAIFAARAMTKSKVNNDANDAQQRAINAMQAELVTLRGIVEDIKKENAYWRRIIETLRVALEKQGLIISISGEAIIIEDSKKSTTIRIQSHDSSN